MGHFHSNCAFPSHQLEVLEVPCSGTQTFWPFQVVRHILWRKTAMGIFTLISAFPSFVIFVHLRLRLWRWEDVQEAVSYFSLSPRFVIPFSSPAFWFHWGFCRFCTTAHHHLSTVTDSAGNESKEGFNSPFFPSFPASQAHPKFCMHGYLFPMPIAVGPFPHPSYDTTAGEFLSFSPSSSFSKDSGRDLGCVSVLCFFCCKCTWPRPLESSFTNQSCLVGCPKHTLRGSATFSLLQPSCAGMGCAQHLLLWARQEDKSTLSHLFTHWDKLEPHNPSPGQCWLSPRIWFPGIAQV